MSKKSGMTNDERELTGEDAAEIVEHLVRKGLSRASLAETLGVAVSTTHRWSDGAKPHRGTQRMLRMLASKYLGPKRRRR